MGDNRREHLGSHPEPVIARGERVSAALYQLSDRLHRTTSIQDVYDAALDGIMGALQCDRASILLLDNTGVMRFVAWRGLSDAYRRAVDGHSPWKQTEHNAVPICMNNIDSADLTDSLRAAIKAEGIGAAAFIPLVASGQLIGKFMTYFNGPHEYRADEIDLCLTIARQLTFGIDRTRAEDALRVSEERLRLATSAGNVGVWDWDIAANTVTWSESLYRIHGLAPGAFGGTVEAFAQLVHPDDAAAVNEAIQRALYHGAPYEQEFRVVRPDGQVVWIYTHASVIRDASGSPVRMLGGTVDVTARKEAETTLQIRIKQQQTIAALGELALSESNLQVVLDRACIKITATLGVEFSKVLELLPDGTHLLLRAGVGWSDGLVGSLIVGGGRESQAGYTLLCEAPVIVPDLREETRFTPPSLLRDHAVISGMTVIIRSKGGTPWGVLGTCSTRRITFTPDDVNFLVAVANILSSAIERAKDEAALRESEARFRVMADAAPVMVWISGIDKSCTWRNKQWLEFVGRSMEQELRTGWAENVHREDVERCLNTYVAAFDARRPFSMDYRLRRHDGEYRWILDHGVPCVDAHGEFTGYIGSCIDITERKRTEDELLKSSKLESIGVLAGGIAHDFNNLLTAVVGNLYLSRSCVDPDHALYANLVEAEKACMRAQSLTLQLLTFSRGGAPILKICDIGSMLDEWVRFTLRGSNVSPYVEVQPDLWPIKADEGQLNQVMNNLVLNAQQAMAAGGVVQILARNIVVDTEQGSLFPGQYVRISVADRGSGIPRDLLSKIFDPFFTTKPKGRGLGLATSYAIVAKHKGHLTIESEVGLGTTAFVYLPASPTTLMRCPNETTRSAQGTGSVLFMDDEASIREFVTKVLEQTGYDVACVESGTEAVERYRKAWEAGRPFDVVILDLTVPGGMGGKEAIAQLVSIDPHVKAIVSSGYSTDPVMAEFGIYGFCGRLVKPYQIEELIEILNRIIGDRVSIR